ncbi:MAG: hypothetical protein COZ06_21010 [Armatimonadetes bacterium CG_4_10_14_3_um_filter_66_18]|nr:DUF3592 domain-containing protein [Armatimonadota bacterium]PIU92836.1 MAG: hypothetical protein COS65_15830 [Armatimonadetes bacterium CG06_land_8_20_14_3_00_66_21]PIX38571.1 MAG: hypothetical protein COZ57_30250 [Armatimonadetes bacterium CG_4_8_14_3_um_filter_66_20]PIY44228.1 MAG: hypothetical protein COZ06_21010 [Armatimonadetes bacterium CG_4_10_14_3_um_filter_66_18]PIZ45962.1 MAG: hypothetical protein COY42_11335 [Armatimonadetes bacterium CG_4_10_14_0_8_um_filter_66_14]PJB72243.1 MAG
MVSRSRFFSPRLTVGNRPGASASPGCMTLFFGVFLLFGLGFLGFFGYQAWKEVRVRTVYRETTCVILNKRLKENSDSDGTTYAPEFTFRYTVDGRDYTCTGYDSFGATSSGRQGKLRVLAEYEIGGAYPCWYDPDDPERAVLVRKVSWMYAFGLIPLVFVGIGLGGVVWGVRNLGKSPEEQSASRAPAKGGALQPDWTQVLPPVKVVPGQFLAKRLQRGTSQGCELGGLLLFSLFWNGIVSVFVWHVVQEWQSGHRPYFLTLFMTPFLLVGVACALWLIRQLLVAGGVKETLVEIEREPVRPGETVSLRFAQPGPLSLYGLSARLICEEKISYTRGTDTYHESHVCEDRELFQMPAMQVPAGSSWDQTVSLTLPDDAMHSFHAGHNDLVWKIVVKGEIKKWPDFEHAFPFRVVTPKARRELE